MRKEKVVISNPSGLHARNASEFVALARTFESSVYVKNLNNATGHFVNAKNPMHLLSADFNQGDVMELEVEGADEDETVSALMGLVRSFGA